MKKIKANSMEVFCSNKLTLNPYFNVYDIKTDIENKIMSKKAKNRNRLNGVGFLKKSPNNKKIPPQF
jgi:hypothetical protein